MTVFAHPWPGDLPECCPHCASEFLTARNLSIGPGKLGRFFRACAYWGMVLWMVLSWIVLGMGLGTFLAGPLSDSFGRKPVVAWGAALYIFASALAWAAPSLELVLLARVLQGLGAAAARVVPIAITRDFYAGRGMARIVSFIMMVFMPSSLMCSFF